MFAAETCALTSHPAPRTAAKHPASPAMVAIRAPVMSKTLVASIAIAAAGVTIMLREKIVWQLNTALCQKTLPKPLLLPASAGTLARKAMAQRSSPCGAATRKGIAAFPLPASALPLASNNKGTSSARRRQRGAMGPTLAEAHGVA